MDECKLRRYARFQEQIQPVNADIGAETESGRALIDNSGLRYKLSSLSTGRGNDTAFLRHEGLSLVSGGGNGDAVLSAPNTASGTASGIQFL